MCHQGHFDDCLISLIQMSASGCHDLLQLDIYTQGRDQWKTRVRMYSLFHDDFRNSKNQGLCSVNCNNLLNLCEMLS